MRVVAMLGSLRKRSFNRALALEAGKYLPAGTSFELLELGALPHYDQDVFDAGLPESAAQLGKAIAAADGLLIVSPEYNYSMPGLLKNGIDWLSRLPEKPLANKPVGIASASMGIFGGVRMQLHLRQALMFTGARMLTRPEFHLGQAQNKFDADLKLVDEETRKHLKGFVDAFVKFVAPA